MLGDQAEVLARAIAAAHDQPVGRQAMLLLARLLEHALVGDLVQHVVLEDELARALEGARLATVGELAPRQAVEGGRRPLARCAAELRPRRRGRSRSPAAARSSRPAAEPSMRAWMTPASVDGTRTSSSLSAETRHGSLAVTMTPSSMSMPISSSTKYGLPSALLASRSRSAAARSRAG